MICSYLVWEHPMELLFGQTEAFAVGAVHHQDDNLKDGDRSAPPRQLWSLSTLSRTICGHEAREVALKKKRLSAPLCCSSMSTSWLEGSPARRYPKLKSASCARWSARRCFRWWATCGRLLLSGCQRRNKTLRHQAALIRTFTTSEVNLQLIQDGCLSSIVQTHNDDFVFWRKVKTTKASD